MAFIVRQNLTICLPAWLISRLWALLPYTPSWNLYSYCANFLPILPFFLFPMFFVVFLLFQRVFQAHLHTSRTHPLYQATTLLLWLAQKAPQPLFGVDILHIFGDVRLVLSEDVGHAVHQDPRASHGTLRHVQSFYLTRF